ncbi:MAG TPA: DNA polymerase Y family protein [Candidatus Krumholzibacteria bacterium]|nr:DNA polymerase Y family protein [Candidatus Krumholzibacteria bacterium]
MVRTACTERLTTASRIARTDRIACVDLPALPLQLLLRDHPDWRGQPAAVVEEDHPQARLLWVNEAARSVGVLPGLRYAAALAVCRGLNAAPVAPARIAAATESLHRHFLRHSPRVEPARHDPGVFWLDAGGLERVAGSPARWARRLWEGLDRAGFTAGVVVGWSRFGSACLARVHRQPVVVPSPAREAAACRAVPLVRLELDPRLRDDLVRLGLETVGDLMALPPSGLAARFGQPTRQLIELARGLRFDPLQPVLPPEPVRAEQVFEEAAETDAWRLLFVVKRLLHPLLERLADQGEAVALLHLDLVLEDRARTRRRDSLRPAEPTLDAVLLMELVRLRLEAIDLSAGAERVILELEPADAPPGVLELFRRHPRRDPAAALRAVARVRAELGDAAVVRAELAPGHLPEQSWRWQPITTLDTPAPGPVRDAPLVRRVLARPRPLMAGPLDLVRDAPEQLLRAAAGPGGATFTHDGVRTHGPHLLSTAWWSAEQRRSYHFIEATDGPVLWVFHANGYWYLQGRVE